MALGLFGRKQPPAKRVPRTAGAPKAPKPAPEPSVAQLNAATNVQGVTVFGYGCPGSIWNDSKSRVTVMVFRIITEDERQTGSLPIDFFILEPGEEKHLKMISRHHRFFIWSEQGEICARITPVQNGTPQNRDFPPPQAAAT